MNTSVEELKRSYAGICEMMELYEDIYIICKPWQPVTWMLALKFPGYDFNRLAWAF